MADLYCISIQKLTINLTEDGGKYSKATYSVNIIIIYVADFVITFKIQHYIGVRQWHVSNALIFERYLSVILVRHLLLSKTIALQQGPLSKQPGHALLGYFSEYTTLTNVVIITLALPW